MVLWLTFRVCCLVFCCRKVMAEYMYIGAGMNVSLLPVFRKRIASVEVVIWAAISNDRKTDLVHVPGVVMRGLPLLW
jgi:hypothetical protein